jgi:large subunit ribosomal protein L15
MHLHTLRPPEGSRKRKKRLGRGIGSGHGKTAGRGTKGQKARRQIRPGFEGGQTPLHRRLPVRRGFRNVNHKEYAIINLEDLEAIFQEGDSVTPEVLLEKGVIKKVKDGVKVLARGKLTKKLKVNAHQLSKAAESSILAAGGEVTRL